MIEDIQANMDAVETVEHSIYTEIMNGYTAKLTVMDEMKSNSQKMMSY